MRQLVLARASPISEYLFKHHIKVKDTGYNEMGHLGFGVVLEIVIDKRS